MARLRMGMIGGAGAFIGPGHRIIRVTPHAFDDFAAATVGDRTNHILLGRG